MAKKAAAKFLTIGDVATASGTSADTLRYYEKMQLITPGGRSAAGYRLYTEQVLPIIAFIRGAKSLNFTLEEIRQLLALNASDRATCGDMLARTQTKIREAEEKIRELKQIKSVLDTLVARCPGDGTKLSACPIIDHLKSGGKKRKIKAAFLIAAFATLASPQPSEARPISYVGGTMLMVENDETGHTLNIDYTISPRYALGLYAKKESGDDDFTTAGPQLNTLLKRWNFPDAQGNIYNMTGVGVSTRDGHSQASAWTSFAGDYETRRIYTSYEIRALAAGDIETSLSQRARVGVAPYIRGYDDVQPWLMLQVDHHPSDEDTLVITPLIRAFYKTNLAELGYSSNGRVMFNIVKQF